MRVVSVIPDGEAFHLEGGSIAVLMVMASPVHHYQFVRGHMRYIVKVSQFVFLACQVMQEHGKK